MDDPATALAKYLCTQGFGTLGTDVFVNVLPDSPVECVSVIASGGFRITGSPVRYPSFQILHRNTRVVDGELTARSIFTALDDAWGAVSGYSGRLLGQQEPGSYYRDGNNYPVFTLNFILEYCAA